MTYNRRGRPFKISRLYGFNKSRQLDGTMSEGSQYGTYCLTAARVSAGWGSVAEHRWPYPRGNVTWPPDEPAGLDKIARFNRTFSHFRVRSIHDARTFIAFGGPFTFSVPITSAWQRASGGAIPMPRNAGEFVEDHAICAVGYDDQTQLLTFVNSWGANWGDGGFGFLPYKYFEAYLSDAWFRFPTRLGRWRPDQANDDFVQRRSIFRNVLGYSCAVIDLWNFKDDIRIAWSFITHRDGCLDIEDFFVRPEFYASTHQSRLTKAVIDFAAEQGLPIRLWIARADLRSRAANFRTINDFLRAELGIGSIAPKDAVRVTDTCQRSGSVKSGV